jgi:hypothetical protein
LIDHCDSSFPPGKTKELQGQDASQLTTVKCLILVSSARIHFYASDVTHGPKKTAVINDRREEEKICFCSNHVKKWKFSPKHSLVVYFLAIG